MSKAQDDSWDKVEYHEFPEVKVDWEETTEVQGTLKWREDVPTTGLDGSERMATMYCLETEAGVEIGVWSTANLKPQMDKIRDGQEVKIVQGKQRRLSGGRTMRTFDVFSRGAPVKATRGSK